MTTTTDGRSIVEHVIGATGEVVVRVHSGELVVTASDGDTARVRDLDGRDLEERFTVEPGDGRLVVVPRDRAVFDIGIGRRHRGGRLAVEVPRMAVVSFDTTSGELTADGLSGEQRYRTASGRVALRGVSGAIAFDAVSGDVGIHVAGAVDLSGRTVSGDLKLQGGSVRSAAIATTSGDIALESPLIGPGPYSLQTVSGDARVITGAEGLRIEARTVTGEVISNAGGSRGTRGRGEIVVGSGGLTLTFRSISGDLRVATGPAAGAVLSHAAPVPPAAPAPPAPPAEPVETGPDEDPRLAILRDLESGVIDVETATARLAELEEGDDV